MKTLVFYYSTTLGKKFIVAVTGLILFAYVFIHMLGNLQIYFGPGVINGYAHFLHSKRATPLLWSARIVLLVAFALHMICTIQLALRNLKTRPVGYLMRQYRESDYAARTMMWTGPLIALGLLYHLLHLTAGAVQPAPYTPDDIYASIVGGFKVKYVAAVYIVWVVALGFHFYHGLWSWFQTLGLSHPAYDKTRRSLATILTAIVVVGDISIPLAVQLGLVG